MDIDLKGVTISVCVCVCPRFSGQERYGNMTRVYYREAVGALVVFDVTRASTFEAVLKWKDDLDSKVRCCKVELVFGLHLRHRQLPESTVWSRA